MNRWTTTYGITRVRACCLFRWFERETGPRTIEIRAEHCLSCIEEVRRIAADRGLRLLERGPMRRSVLVVDDDASIREGLASVLEDEGYFAYRARNGQEALAVLQQMPAPSVVLVDLTMPIMNGWQLIPALKAAGHPVIVITAADVSAVEGVRTIIKKPLSIEGLLTAIEGASP
jgi:CheY-like chemotaxis protein